MFQVISSACHDSWQIFNLQSCWRRLILFLQAKLWNKRHPGQPMLTIKTTPWLKGIVLALKKWEKLHIHNSTCHSSNWCLNMNLHMHCPFCSHAKLSEPCNQTECQIRWLNPTWKNRSMMYIFFFPDKSVHRNFLLNIPL